MEQRSTAVASAMDDIRNIETEMGVTRAGVEAIRDRLIELAGQRDLFPLEDFPAPDPDAGVSSHMYRLAQDDDDRFALYAQTTSGGTSTPVHNHTTWAVVVGFDGQELNRFYERNADGGVTQVDEHMVEAGTGVAMLPDDLHAIRIDGGSLNFHCYGLALERLDQREYYNEAEGTWKIFNNIDGIKEARTGLQAC
ncbi:MAG: cysteine dioxygenase [Acidimicrobiales bacterium]|nr:cysteine dioxygenase [Acidimicrobiales bacterium]RZV46632.1 MAG: cysteine dioxygenase [Acidimicrobiales bacterium]